MPISDDYHRLACSAIIIDRENRQRKVIDTSGLKASIAQHGVLQPIIVDRSLNLVIGERRLTASLELGLPSIPVRFLDELDPIELQLVELEENLKRSDLHWRDQARAIGQIHQLYLLRDPEWHQVQTAKVLNIDQGSLSALLRVYKDLESPKIAQATSWISAFNLLARLDSRKADSAMSDLLETGGDIFESAGVTAGTVVLTPPTLGQEGPGQSAGIGVLPQIHGLTYPPNSGDLPGVFASPIMPPVKPAFVPPAESILNDNFTLWAPTYTGPKFNFIHCDFPYGINAFAGSNAATGARSTKDMGAQGLAGAQEDIYDDDPEVYWQLVQCLCNNLDRVMQHSGHLMFWFSMKHYVKTLEMFRDLAPSLVFNHMPLIWLKSDGRGVLPDTKRGPRQIYETCLIASREDRFIIRATSNAYSAPSDKQYHHSTKPEPVLRYFMSMFVDDTTRMLDPTCGSGSALRAAESLGAASVLGLELDPEHCENARGALRKFRILRTTT